MTTPAPPAPRMSATDIRRLWQLAGLIMATFLVAYLCYKILHPFLPGLVWAVALAIVARPLQRRLERRIKNRTLSSLIAMLVIVLLVVIPAIVITEQVVAEAVGAVRTIASPEARARISNALSDHRRLALAWQWVQQRVDLGQQAQMLTGRIGAALPAAFAVSLNGLTQFLVALFSMFFMLRDSEYFLRALRFFIPLSEGDATDVFARVQQTVEATLRGRVVVAAIQGALGGLMFAILGLPAALLWGTVMAVLSLVPLIGAFVVWIPAALYLAISGSAGKALILAIWGVFVVGTADNFLYPILVGRDLQQHTLKLFFALLGGVAAFGLSGVIIGPVTFALADALLEVWSGGNRKVDAS